MNTIPKIAIDFDEVLFPMLPQLHKYANRKYTNCNKKYQQNGKYKYLFKDIFDVSDNSAKKLVYGFYSSKEAFETKPLSGSIMSIKKLSKKNKLYIITGRQNYYWSKRNTEYLIDTYFPNLFYDIYYSNSYSLVGESTSKSEICNNLGISHIIDDSPDICIECENNGIKSVLFGTYPWTYYDSSINSYLKNWDDFEL